MSRVPCDRCYFSGHGGSDVVHNCKAKWHSFVYFKKYSSYPLQTWNSYSVSQRECIEARMVTQWPVFVELSALVDLDKIAIRRDIYSANSCWVMALCSFESNFHLWVEAIALSDKNSSFVSPCIQGRYIVFVLYICLSVCPKPCHSRSPKRVEGFSWNLCQMFTSCRRRAEPMFRPFRFKVKSGLKVKIWVYNIRDGRDIWFCVKTNLVSFFI